MDEEAVSAAREKLLTGLPETCAQPGTPELWLSAPGARIAGVRLEADGSAAVAFALHLSPGWYKPDDGIRRNLPDGLPWFWCVLPWPPETPGFFSGTLWALHAWMSEEAAVDVYASPGRWTTVLAPGVPYRHGAVRSAFLPGMSAPALDQQLPPGSRCDWKSPGRDEVTLWAGEHEVVHVSLGVHDDEAGTVYLRQWAVPHCRTEDFAGMMTHRFGKPQDAILDAAAAGALAEQVVIVGGEGTPGGCDCGEDG